MNFITKLFTTLLERVKNRQDSEHEQAAVRVVISFTFLFYLLATKPVTENMTEIWTLYFNLIAVFILFSLTLFCSTLIWRNRSPIRRMIGMIVDITAFSFGLIITGETGAPWYGVYLWVTFGNGFRFGTNYLYLSAILSVVGFSSVLLLTPYWQTHTALGLGLLIALIILPGYAAVLTNRINEERRRAEEANQAKTEFLARMSHEIRTPLNGIIGTGELLRSCHLGQEEKEYVDTIYASGHTLLRLIEDILDISKIEAGKLEIEQVEFDLHALINTTIKILSVQVNTEKLRLTSHIGLDIPFQLIGDPLHLRQILINLIGNAIKFTEKGSVELRCHKLREENARTLIRFEVIDTGIGIPEEKQAQIFEKFTQADESTTRRFGGTGLGTTIAKQLVELMGGRIGIMSSPGIGTTLWFDIEFDHQSELIDENEVLKMRQCRILRLAQHAVSITNISQSLRGWGIPFQNVESVNETIRKLQEGVQLNTPIEVVILDGIPYNKATEALLNSIEKDHSHSKTSLIMVQKTGENLLPFETGRLSDRVHVLKDPVENNLLFNALHASHLGNHENDGIVSQADHLAASDDQTSHPLEILIAEDNSINRMVISRMLGRAGHNYQQVENGQELLDALATRQYDLVIADMQMPMVSGLEAYKMYRFAHPDNAAIPFIILTANATTDARKSCEEAGIEWFLTKPISSEKLLSTITRATTANNTTDLTDKQTSMAGADASEVPVIDYGILREVAKLAPDQAFLTMLMDSLEKDGAQLIKEMSEAIHTQDIKHFKALAHALKGSAANLGLVQLQQHTIDAEEISSRQLDSEGKIALEAIQTAFDEGKQVLYKEFDLSEPEQTAG